MKLKIISAGAGSGKTYRLTTEMVDMMQAENADGTPRVRPNGIIATTFTNKAAAELKERVRVRLLENQMHTAANDLSTALIGTVHGLGVNLLKRFAYEAGVSPKVDILADEDRQIMFNQSLAMVLTAERVSAMEDLCNRLGMNKRELYDWRKDVRYITEIARANNFSKADLEKSKKQSFATFQQFLPTADGPDRTTLNRQLQDEIAAATERLDANDDSTKTTKNTIEQLRKMHHELRTRHELFWYDWVKIVKMKPGAKSRDDMEPLQAFALQHEHCPDFHRDLQQYIERVFDLADAAIEEYDRYKLQRGLIDFTDMEAMVNKLLDHPDIKQVLSEELDLLMVDEFQDTSPMQLEIFLKLSKLATYSVWVGDPKQSIYGFRGADPALMKAIIEASGGIKKENIQEYSWRSRADVVYATNAVFTKAFEKIPEAQVRLFPKREKNEEPIEASDAIKHWHFEPEPDIKRTPPMRWMDTAIAETLRLELENGLYILPKGEQSWRKALPGDVAILCRTNRHCEKMAEALHHAGLKAAIARTGLLQTAETKLVLACLKFILNPNDSLSVAEVLLLAADWPTAAIVEHRLRWLNKKNAGEKTANWAAEVPIVKALNRLREEVVELSSAELLSLLTDELDVRRKVVKWGRKDQRLDNLDVLNKLSLQYEEACNRLHTAASPGGFLLWLNDLESKGEDYQGSGIGADAVNVLTYHKSKGLEYPVVLCHDLENDLRSEVWGAEIVQESDGVDLDNLLGNRWLRFWVNPYGDQIKNTPIYERIQESKAQQEKSAAAREEESRLLYVGITRARDYLIIPSRKGRPTKWLNRVCNGKDDYTTLDPYISASPWEWNGTEIPVETQVAVFGKDFQETAIPEEELTFIESLSGKKEHRPLWIDAEKEDFSEQYNVVAQMNFRYAPEFEAKGDAEVYEVAKMLKAFCIGDRLKYPSRQRLEMATGFLQRYKMEAELNPEELLERNTGFLNYVAGLPQSGAVIRNYQLHTIREGRQFQTAVDFVLIDEEGITVIQNSGFSGKFTQLERKAKALSDWMYLVKTGLENDFDQPFQQLYVHFVLHGCLVEVTLSISLPNVRTPK